MQDSTIGFWTVVVAATAVAVNAGLSIFLHFRRATFEERLANRKFDYDVALAERKAALDFLADEHKRKQALATAILEAFYEVKQMMPAIRSPMSMGSEGETRPLQYGEPEGVAR